MDIVSVISTGLPFKRKGWKHFLSVEAGELRWDHGALADADLRLEWLLAGDWEIKMENEKHPSLQFFKFAHLPENLRQYSKPFSDLAVWMNHNLPDGHEKDKAFDKLLEAKDAAVRANIPSENG